ncbi:6-bladed beta-propeller [Parabacteroides sp. OttesenSCG-928-G07]|nr:6-bladed beta-propeller [Parabacteroides sp. OttesenSCG-928-G07]
MQRVSPLIFLILFVLAGCGGNQQLNDDFITVDVTKSYPKKELILQDIFDVEYVPLETNDEFITSGIIEAIGKDIIVSINTGMGGDIFIFDRNGKGLRKINRKGQGPEEYVDASYFTIDEKNNELVITDSFGRSIIVYDLLGNFKRRLSNDRNIYGYFGQFDQDHFICRYLSGDFVNGKYGGLRNELFIMSKKDGSITNEIAIPFDEKIWPQVISPDGSRPSPSPRNLTLIPHKGNWIVTEISSDTIYNLLSDYSLTPLIVRTPTIESMDTKVFLYPSVITDSHYFMQTARREYDFATRTGWPRTDLVYDRRENAIFEYVVYNDDLSGKTPVLMSYENRRIAYPTQNDEIVFFHIYEAFDLIEANNEGKLKGRLKEIAANLEEEDNPVIMLVKHKK